MNDIEIVVTVSGPKRGAEETRRIIGDAIGKALEGKASEVHLSLNGRAGLSIDLEE